VILFAEKITPRLQYIAGFISTELFNEKWLITADRDFFSSAAKPKINYSDKRISEQEFWICPQGLLSARGVQPQITECFEKNGCKAFFPADGDFAFDVFAASFYLLSRYEEYLAHEKDMYGRYAHENSLAYKQNFLHLPLVNIWLGHFKKALHEKFPSLIFRQQNFRFIPTYDIDEPYAYRSKGFKRTAGGIAKSVIEGEWSLVNDRLSVLAGTRTDPYDAYHFMDALHRKYDLKPIYFFHSGLKTGKYDKNIPISKKKIKQLIRQHADKYETGIHPSWKSGDEKELLLKEIRLFELVSGKKVTASRQHYIRFTLPETFRELIRAGITEDYSMGYGSINGFRASVASSFYWYDLQREEQTGLLLYPFCYMDANSFFEQKFTTAEVLGEMRQYRKVIQSAGGTMITIWHNNFLGSAGRFTGWKEVYEQFIKETVS